MYSDVRDLLHQAKSEREVHEVLYGLCRQHGQVVRADVLWGTDVPRHVMCMVEMSDFLAAHAVARDCGAMVYGMTQVVFRYEAPPDFDYTTPSHVV